jgi:hypothetical protein
MSNEKPLPQIISRQAAYAQGLRKFFTSEPCRKGHISERYVSNGACIACLNGAFKFRQNAFSRDLQPFASQRLWVPRSIGVEGLPELEKYLQRCILEYTKHTGRLTPDLEEALVLQLEKM